MITKKCPMQWCSPLNMEGCNCEEDNCAWWDKHHLRCAILSISYIDLECTGGEQ